MTVLIATGSPDGIALAADGFRRDFQNTYCTDAAQKVWDGKTRDGHAVVFGWCGQTTLAKLSSTFSFAEFSLVILRNVDLAVYDNSPQEFASDFARTIQAKVGDFLSDYDPQLSTAPLADSIATIAFGWFAGAKPMFAEVNFTREDGVVTATIVTLMTDGGDFVRIVSGSPTLYESRAWALESLRDAVAAATEFAQACVDNRNTIADCTGYGGHVHVGVVSESGFFWAVPPVAEAKESCECHSRAFE
jgi:hypothetical protein